MRSGSKTPPVVVDARVVSGSGGGPDKTILNSPRYLTGAGYRMVCAYLHHPGDTGFEQLRQKAARWQAPLVSITDRGPWDWRVLTQALALCRRERVRIWHGHDYKTNALGLLLRRFWPMHLVTTVHGWVNHTSRTPLYYKIDKACLPRYQRVICVSPDLHSECLALGVRGERCVLLENGIDTTEFSRKLSIAEAKRRQGVPPGRLIIGAAGRLAPEKAFGTLIRAVHRLLQSGLDLELWIAGEGDDQRQLQDLATELGCAGRVRLLGYQADIRSLFESMDLFALSSLREGLPNVLLEAMAMEVPVVATRIAGVPRLIKHEGNGLLVEPGDLESLVEGLRRLLTDADLRESLRLAGRQTIEAGYSFAVRMQSIAAIYDELLFSNNELGSSRPGLTESGARLPSCEAREGVALSA